jgi:hypothetical protein
MLAVLTFGAAPLPAEDVCVTSYTGGSQTDCNPSCPYDFDTVIAVPNFSSACLVGRNHCRAGTGTNGVWMVVPTLATAHGTYRVFVTKCQADDCSPDIMVSMTTTGGALADANGTAQTSVLTTAFQKTNSVNTWTLVGYITNSTTQPNVYFAYASGTAARFYMDAVDFQSVITNPATPARITQILHSNAVTISGTGPLSHPFALVSSTDAAKALYQWTPEQTNTAGTGTFTFSLTPGTAKAKFFRVITQ